jgi:hypothetical protein
MTSPDEKEGSRDVTSTPGANVHVLKALTSITVMVLGVGTVITLALARVIQDGETIAALSAVMSATVGTHALNRKANADE